ncbi:MAG: ATP-binding protein [Dysgonamonadaceae bacterium]|jgi:predicted AAA+ superfamily ATPase|nr:ATP-binding protein [Dysgonamonadaceae bacterium]
MEYLLRTLSDDILRVSNSFKVLLINGARQIGKTTLLKHTAEQGRKYVTLDNPADLLLAKTDPKGFLDTYSPPVIIDEIQYAPELFPYIKMLADNSDEHGLVWLTGSQQYNMMQGVTESLAGRVAIMDMYGFSIYEAEGKAGEQTPFLPSNAPKNTLKNRNIAETFNVIWQGSFPAVIHLDEKDRRNFYDSYIRTYIERDVRQLINIGNEVAFITFLKVVAARTAQELNMDDIARSVGISHTTAKNWLSVLKASGIVYLLQPYFKNITKRLTKTPKLYFLDTGLAAHLAGWTTPEALKTGVSAGSFFETFVIAEILKSYCHNGETPQIYFFRDERGKEIDLLIYKDGKYYPIEIKKHATPSRQDISAFNIFSKLEETGEGCEICLTSDIQPLAPNATAISVWNI